MSENHYMTVDEIRKARAELLDELARRGLDEDSVYEHAHSWQLRPDERALFQKISDYDWILSLENTPRDAAAA